MLFYVKTQIMLFMLQRSLELPSRVEGTIHQLVLGLLPNRSEGVFCLHFELHYAIFIGPESDHWEYSLTDSCLVNLIDVTLAFECQLKTY